MQFRAKWHPLCDCSSSVPGAHTLSSTEAFAGLPLTSHSSLSVLINGCAAFWGPAALAALLRKKEKSKGSWSKSARTELFLHTPWSVQVTKALAHLEQGASWWPVIAAPSLLHPSYCLVMGGFRMNRFWEPTLKWTKRTGFWFGVELENESINSESNSELIQNVF